MGNNGGKNYAKAIDCDEFVTVKTYNGELKAGKRHGEGIYLYPNGDMYDGEWRKSKKYGKGIYTFSDGKRLDGYFYKDRYIGKSPNDKILKRMEKKRTKSQGDNEPPTEQTDISLNTQLDDNTDSVVKLKSEGSNRRRAESMRRNKWLRDKYNLKGGTQKNNTNETTDIKRSYSQGDKRRTNKEKTEDEERKESKKLRESIRAKYKL